MRKFFLCCFLILLIGRHLNAQQDSSKIDYRKRKILLVTSTGLLTAGSLVYLSEAWYRDYRIEKFHFFNDNKEWLQMDKAGHIFTTYQTGRIMMDCFDWAGFKRKQKLYIGGTIGLAYMTVIEVLDGYSSGWGYSWGDQLCDVIGAAGAIAQEAAWSEQRLVLKFSFAQSGLAKYNPSLLGSNFYEQWLKDYNGQTYWLSFNPFNLFKNDAKVPRWLCLSMGYSAYGMIGGHYNNVVAQDPDGKTWTTERERRFYLSLDVDLTKIKTRSNLLRSVFSVFNILKFPAPALQISQRGVKAYSIYY